MQPISYKQETGSTERLPGPGAPRALLRFRSTGESALQVEPFLQCLHVLSQRGVVLSPTSQTHHAWSVVWEQLRAGTRECPLP